MTTIDSATLGKLLEGVNPSDLQSLFSDAGLFGQIKKALVMRLLRFAVAYSIKVSSERSVVGSGNRCQPSQ
jgi:putative transposase